MDISYNSFSGSILPFCSNPNLQYLKHMHLQGNKFTGLISRALLNSSYLLTLYIKDNIFFGNIPDCIRLLSNLRILLFRGNQLSGSIPIQLCQLNQINLMDLSNNYFNGSILPCFNNITFGTIGTSDRPFMQRSISSFSGYETYQYRGIFESIYVPYVEDMYDEVDKVEFVTKSRSSSYKGDILNFMSGLDLSHNKLIGEISFELGKLSSVRALNLSHNLLTRPIPKAFSNLAQVESLDLSYNMFTVAHNNLSGKILDRKAQFGTFEASSYEGNPFLCGPPLEKNCTAIVDSPHLPTIVSQSPKSAQRDTTSDAFVTTSPAFKPSPRTKYAKNLVSKFGLESAKHARTPMSTSLHLSKDSSGTDVDPTLYRSMIGSLLYLTAIHPDIAFSVGVCARYQASLKKSYLLAVKRIIKYVNWTLGYGFWFSTDTTTEITGFSDADWVGCADDKKSASGGCFYLGNNLVSWHSKKKNAISLSTVEAEYIAAGSYCAQMLWMKQMLHEILDITSDVFRLFLGLPEFPTIHFPLLTCTGVDFDRVATKLCGVSRTWIARPLIQQNELLPRFHLLNIIVCANIHVTTHSSHITQDQGFLTSLGVLVFEDDEVASPVKPITKLTAVSKSSSYSGGPSGVGGIDTGDDPLAEEAEYDAAAAGAPEMPELHPRSFRGQQPQFEQSVIHRLDLLDARLDTLDGHLGFEKLLALRKLETLNLEWNELDDSILPSLSALRSLKMLNLQLAYFRNLERLDLSYNQFNGIQGKPQ
ncbi:hypothetical protein HYC85_028590 [Camellia sinensis]|uniref:Reverse transcriptase Ty1/copia-type domain-containing protein n=1 Tax=Camellia sinensis TaxID=4442 RepID=A0A7J7FVU8_CAMSI|nr:hypothetical protein HYC85_028590 [Camellia sinensis]